MWIRESIKQRLLSKIKKIEIVKLQQVCLGLLYSSKVFLNNNLDEANNSLQKTTSFSFTKDIVCVGNNDVGDVVYWDPDRPGGPDDASHVPPVHADGYPAQVTGHVDQGHARVQAVT